MYIVHMYVRGEEKGRGGRGTYGGEDGKANRYRTGKSLLEHK